MPNPVYSYKLDIICKYKSTKWNVMLTFQLNMSFAYTQLNEQTVKHIDPRQSRQSRDAPV